MTRNITILVSSSLVAVTLALYVFVIAPSTETPQKEPLTIVTHEPERREAPPGMKEYRSTRYRFSLLHSENMIAEEQDEGDGAATISFENPSEGRGFQIFVVPFLESQITEERFRMDVPSGIRREMQNVTIDGAVGASFYSESLELGETAEVWFVRDGYLYEVTTFKAMAPWLSEILATWKFIDG